MPLASVAAVQETAAVLSPLTADAGPGEDGAAVSDAPIARSTSAGPERNPVPGAHTDWLRLIPSNVAIGTPMRKSPVLPAGP